MKLLCFPFRNEVEILETKLETLGDYVDRIIIAEGAYTFSGHKREPVFLDWAKGSATYAKYEKKILYHLDMSMGSAPPVDRFQNGTEYRWGRDIHLRDSLGDIALLYNPDDTVILTDCDEIPSPKWIKRLDGISNVRHALLWRHCYYVDYRAPLCRLHEQVCRAFPVKMLKQHSMEEMARGGYDQLDGDIYDGQGWHFTYMGGAEAIRKKLGDFAHGEFDKPPYNDLQYIEDRMFTGRDLFNREYLNCVRAYPIDLPPYLVANKDKWPELWSPR